MNTNHIANLKDILETEQAYLPECIITAAKNHLKAIGATIATVISPKIIDLDSDEPEYVVGADPIAQEKTQSTANVPQITVTTTVEKTISTPTIATSVTATAQSSTQVATAQQATASTAQRPTGKKSGQNPRQHGMQQPQ